jgi:cell division protein FtsW
VASGSLPRQEGVPVARAHAASAIAQSELNHILLAWLALLAFGTVMVGSAAVALGETYLSRHLLFLVVSLIVFALVFSIPPSAWNRFYWLGWLVSFVIAVAVLIPGVGHEVNGAQRWIRFGGFSLQSAEVAKFGLCIYLAGYLDRHVESLRADPKVLMVPLGMVVIVCGLLVAEPDLGSAVVVVAASVGLLFLAGAKLRYFLLLLLVGASGLAALIWDEPYRMQRLIAFLDPWSVAFGSGYQLTQALIAFGRGDLWGLGLGEGVQKLFYLPEAHNDFIFAVVAEELGSFGAIGLVILLAFLVLRVLAAARGRLYQGDRFAGYVAYFTGLLLGIQMLVNVGVNTGVLPTKGLTLPFVSYGGNSLMVSCALLALVMRSGWEWRHG